MESQLLRRRYRSALTGGQREYLLCLPNGYDRDKAKGWPLLLFLHGMGERGDDVQLVLRYGPIREALRPGRNLPFIMLGPQCPILQPEDMAIPPAERIRKGQATTWATCEEEVMEILNGALEECRVDRNRVCLTGMSMGGYGAWMLACHHPHQWAAVAPVCGRSEPAEAARIGSTPVWAFHGEQDETVPVAGSIDMVKALQAAGGNARLTLFPELKHNCWDRVYGGEDLYEWLLSHRRESR